MDGYRGSDPCYLSDGNPRIVIHVLNDSHLRLPSVLCVGLQSYDRHPCADGLFTAVGSVDVGIFFFVSSQ